MEDAKEEVRARLSIEDVIGEYVQLKRSGRSFKGLSPFSSEKTPSFFVSPEKNIWHDFSSNKGGDVFSFIMEVEGLDFRGSLELLARKAGVDLSVYQTSGKQTARRKKELLEATRLAMAYFQHSLLKNPRALEYVFKKRGFTKQTVTDFRIGYAPDQGNALVQFLTRKGFTKKDLNDAGLVNRFGGDLFRGRMIVPLLDESGQAIGFTGRVISDDDPNSPKYLNTPATLLYDKSRHIFGLSQAKEAIRKGGYSVLVEGNLDVVSSHQAGVRHVVATAGTALTEHQLRALRRLSPEVRVAFDGDKAGIAATERAIPIASSLGISLSVVTLPGDAKDPDELVRQDVKLWTDAIESAEPAVDWVLKQYQQRENLKTAEGKRRFSSAALTVIKGLADPIEQEHYQQAVASLLNTTLAAVQAKASTNEQPKKSLKQIKSSPQAKTENIYTHLDTVLGAGLLYPLLRTLFRDESADLFDQERQKAVAVYLIDNDDTVGESIPPSLKNIDDYVKIILLRAEKRYDGWREEDIRLEIAELLRRHKAEKQKRQIEKDIKSAEERGDEAEIERLRREHYALIKEVKRG